MQDHASNSSHSSLRGSVRSSSGEEHPVNPVVSFSVPLQITLSHVLPNLSYIRMLLYESTDVSVQDSRLCSLISTASVISCAFSEVIYVFVDIVLLNEPGVFSIDHCNQFLCHSIAASNLNWAASRLGGEARQQRKTLLCQPQQPHHFMDATPHSGTKWAFLLILIEG